MFGYKTNWQQSELGDGNGIYEAAALSIELQGNHERG